MAGQDRGLRLGEAQSPPPQLLPLSQLPLSLPPLLPPQPLSLSPKPPEKPPKNVSPSSERRLLLPVERELVEPERKPMPGRVGVALRPLRCGWGLRLNMDLTSSPPSACGCRARRGKGGDSSCETAAAQTGSAQHLATVAKRRAETSGLQLSGPRASDCEILSCKH